MVNLHTKEHGLFNMSDPPVYRQFGNSVVVLLVHVIALEIVKILRTKG
jgi:site-specific DNA-cytosine methylase